MLRSAFLHVAPLILLFALQGCGSSSSPSRGHIFNEAYGRCPLTSSTAGIAEVCGLRFNFNANAGIFHVRKSRWGIAYAFNCGRKPRDFYLQVAYANNDGGFGESSIVRHGRLGRGVKMETLTDHIAPGLPAYDHAEEIELETSCSWHVRAVRGSKAEVKAKIPPAPPQYRMNSGKVVRNTKAV
ncbi:MAG: hypothetical protein ACRDFS_02210 [Chloroflexota bacterium]